MEEKDKLRLVTLNKFTGDPLFWKLLDLLLKECKLVIKSEIESYGTEFGRRGLPSLVVNIDRKSSRVFQKVIGGTQGRDSFGHEAEDLLHYAIYINVYYRMCVKYGLLEKSGAEDELVKRVYKEFPELGVSWSPISEVPVPKEPIPEVSAPKSEAKEWIDWIVRLARPGEEEEIAKLAIPYREYVSPYVLNPKQVAAYLDEWIVAENPKTHELGGSLHFVTNDSTDPRIRNRNYAYLLDLKQVNTDVVSRFWTTKGAVFKSQPTCPGKGSMKAVTDWLKNNFNEIWSWISLVSPVLDFYEKDGMVMYRDTVYRFMNVYKGDYSDFIVGIWKRGGLSV